MATNNFPVGLPVAPKNADQWPEKRPYLARLVRGALLSISRRSCGQQTLPLTSARAEAAGQQLRLTVRARNIKQTSLPASIFLQRSVRRC